MKKYFYTTICLFGLFLFFFFSAKAQFQCGFDRMFNQQLQKDPNFKEKVNEFEKQWQLKQEDWMQTQGRVVITGTDTVYEIPIVFHIIHTGSAIGTPYNPSVAKIEGVVNYLNQTFGGTFPSYPGPGMGGVNIPIRFVLAKRDPACNATNGINRVNAQTALNATNATKYINHGVNSDSTNGLSDAQLKGIVQWNPLHYYNVWVVNKIDSWDGYVNGSGVAGYAQFPGGLPASDGTVILDAFNVLGQSALPHELGHAFALLHTFQGGCVPVSGCASNGDYVCDTDPCNLEFGCPTGINPCTGTSWVPVKYNLMGYTSCPDRFTEGQKARAMLALLNLRVPLLNSLGATAPGAQNFYPLPVPLSNCANPVMLNVNNYFDMGPAIIQIADLNYISSGYTYDGFAAYIDHTFATCSKPAEAPAHMTVGQAYPVSIGTGLNPENVRVWIDLNNNGTFSPSELVFSSDGMPTDEYRVHTGNTSVIPSTAVTNTPLRMRVISDFINNQLNSACGVNLIAGQVEDFTVLIEPSNPMPVLLDSLMAKVSEDGHTIEVTWKSLQEVNFKAYEIERSVNGKDFEHLDYQDGRGAGTHYLYRDLKPIKQQLYYYRLKLIDQDESIRYSTIVSARIAGFDPEIKVYPNPAKNVLFLVSQKDKARYQLAIKNALGQTIYQQPLLILKAGVPAQIKLGKELSAGIYYIQLRDEAGLRSNIKLIKE